MGVNHECCVVALKVGCVIDGKICMSQRKIMKTVIIAVEKKNMYFIVKTLLIKKVPVPEINGHWAFINVYGCGIAHCTWHTFETKYASKHRVGFHITNNVSVGMCVHDCVCWKAQYMYFKITLLSQFKDLFRIPFHVTPDPNEKVDRGKCVFPMLY